MIAREYEQHEKTLKVNRKRTKILSEGYEWAREGVTELTEWEAKLVCPGLQRLKDRSFALKAFYMK